MRVGGASRRQPATSVSPPRSFRGNPYLFLGRRPLREARLRAYVVRQHRAGRHLTAILADPYVRRLGSESFCWTVIGDPDTLQALQRNIRECFADDLLAERTVPTSDNGQGVGATGRGRRATRASAASVVKDNRESSRPLDISTSTPAQKRLDDPGMPCDQALKAGGVQPDTILRWLRREAQSVQRERKLRDHFVGARGSKRAGSLSQVAPPLVPGVLSRR